MGFNFPYGNKQQLNLDWFLRKFKELVAAWNDKEESIDGALDAEIQKAEDALSDVYTARDVAVAAKNDALQAKADALTAAANAAQYWQNAAASANSAATSAVTALQAAQDAADDADQTSRDRASVTADKAAVAADKATVAADKATVAQDKATVAQDKADTDTIKDNANAAALRSEGWADGTQYGTPVTSDSPYYENNAKYYKEAAEDVLESIPPDYSELAAEVSEQSEKIDDMLVVSYSDNRLDPTSQIGADINTTTGVVTPSDYYSVSGKMPCEYGESLYVIDKATLTNQQSAAIRMAFYTSEDSFIEIQQNVSPFVVPQNAAYCLLRTNKNQIASGNYGVFPYSATTMTEWIPYAEIKKLSDSYTPKEVSESIQSLNSKTGNIENIISANEFLSNGYITVNGTLYLGANWVYTDYISAVNVVSIASKAYQLPNSVALVAFYDKDKNFISSVDAYDGQSGNGVKEGTISVSNIPNNAVFMRFSSYASTSDRYVRVGYSFEQTLKNIPRIPVMNSQIEFIKSCENDLCGYPFSMTFIGDSLTEGFTNIKDSDQSDYFYMNKANYPTAFCKKAEIENKTVIAKSGYSASQMWSDYSAQISNIENQFVIVWLGTNGGLTNTVDTDCAGDDISLYANTNTGNYGKIVKTLIDNGNKVFLAQLCYLSQYPTCNPVIASLAERFSCSLIELDGDDIAELNKEKYHTAYNDYYNEVHFNSLGYCFIANLFYRKLTKIVFDNPSDFDIHIVEE